MKTSNRIHRNGSTKPSKVQPPKEPGIKDGTYTGNEPISLTVFDHLKDKTLAGCDLTAAEWEHIKKSCSASGIGVGTLLIETRIIG